MSALLNYTRLSEEKYKIPFIIRNQEKNNTLLTGLIALFTIMLFKTYLGQEPIKYQPKNVFLDLACIKWTMREITSKLCVSINSLFWLMRTFIPKKSLVIHLKLEIRDSQNLAKLRHGCTTKLSDGGGEGIEFCLDRRCGWVATMVPNWELRSTFWFPFASM